MESFVLMKQITVELPFLLFNQTVTDLSRVITEYYERDERCLVHNPMGTEHAYSPNKHSSSGSNDSA